MPTYMGDDGLSEAERIAYAVCNPVRRHPANSQSAQEGGLAKKLGRREKQRFYRGKAQEILEMRMI